MEKMYQTKDKNIREIPTRQDPYKNPPDKAPEKIPDAEPGEDNPRNPKKDGREASA